MLVIELDSRGWGHCQLCDEYLTPRQVQRHDCAKPKRARPEPPLTLGAAAWGPAGAYEPEMYEEER